MNYTIQAKINNSMCDFKSNRWCSDYNTKLKMVYFVELYSIILLRVYIIKLILQIFGIYISKHCKASGGS